MVRVKLKVRLGSTLWLPNAAIFTAWPQANIIPLLQHAVSLPHLSLHIVNTSYLIWFHFISVFKTILHNFFGSRIITKWFLPVHVSEKANKHKHHTYTTILFLNSGQSRVKVSYSPPSPQIFKPNFSFFMHSQTHGTTTYNRKLSYHRDIAQHAMSVGMLSTAALLNEKSHPTPVQLTIG